VSFIFGMFFLAIKAILGVFAAIIGGIVGLSLAGGLFLGLGLVVLAIIFKVFGGGKY